MTGKNLIKDHTLLIDEVNRILNDNREKYSHFDLGSSGILRQFDYEKKSDRGGYVVLGEDTALELGAPGSLSVSMLLWTGRKRAVGSRGYIIGNSLKDYAGKKISFLQIVMIEVDDDTDPYATELHRMKNLTNKIPGYMTRTIPDRIWIRIHKDLLKKNFTLYSLAEALHKTYLSENPGVRNADVILIAGDDDAIRQFRHIADAAKLISSENKKNRWIEDGTLTCEDFDCSSCSEKKDCDTIKELVIKRRSNSNE